MNNNLKKRLEEILSIAKTGDRVVISIHSNNEYGITHLDGEGKNLSTKLIKSDESE